MRKPKLTKEQVGVLINSIRYTGNRFPAEDREELRKLMCRLYDIYQTMTYSKRIKLELEASEKHWLHRTLVEWHNLLLEKKESTGAIDQVLITIAS